MTEDAGTVELTEEELEGAARLFRSLVGAAWSDPVESARLTAAHLIAAAAKFNITLHEEDAADMIDMFSGPPPGEMGFEDFTRTARQASRGALTR